MRWLRFGSTAVDAGFAMSLSQERSRREDRSMSLPAAAAREQTSDDLDRSGDSADAEPPRPDADEDAEGPAAPLHLSGLGASFRRADGDEVGLVEENEYLRSEL
jgi:hypothetical protein